MTRSRLLWEELPPIRAQKIRYVPVSYTHLDVYKRQVESSVKAGVDVLISGDFGHHDGIDAVMQGVSVIDAGHYGCLLYTSRCV